MTNKAVTVLDLQRMKRQGTRITMLTAYDATFARLVDQAGVDLILVGDSLGMVVQGHDNTLKVTIEQMAYHGAAVSRVTERAHVVVDMPFLSYHVTDEDAVRNAGQLVQNGAHSVKIEGGAERATTINALVRAQIPVMGRPGMRDVDAPDPGDQERRVAGPVGATVERPVGAVGAGALLLGRRHRGRWRVQTPSFGAGPAVVLVARVAAAPVARRRVEQRGADRLAHRHPRGSAEELRVLVVRVRVGRP